MDYPVLNQAPNIAQGVVPGYLSADGKFVPVSAATPIPVTGGESGVVTANGIGAVDDPKVIDSEDDSSLIQSNKGQLDLQQQILDRLSDDWSYLNLIANGTSAAIVTGTGVVRVMVNKKGASSNVLEIYDNLTGSGTKIATIDTTDRTGLYDYRARFGTGLSVVLGTGTAADVTILYRAD